LKENNGHIANEFAGGKAYLPLDDFFIALKQNGFLVTPKQVADSNLVILQYSGKVENEQKLCNYLSPIFANSQEEQIQFRQIFEQNFKASPQEVVPVPVGRWQKIMRHLKKHWWKYVLGAAPGIAAVFYFSYKPVLDPKPVISMATVIADTAKVKNSNAKSIVKVSLYINNQLSDTVHGITLKTKYSWGDNSAVDRLPQHSYSTAGNFILTVYIAVWYRNYYQYTDTITSKVAVCFDANSILIQALAEGYTVNTGKEITFKARINAKGSTKVVWTDFKNDTTVKFKAADATAWYTFYKEGPQIIYCNVVSDSINSPCSVKDSIGFFVYNPEPKPKILFSVPAGANAIQAKYNVKQSWFYLLATLALLSLFFTSFFALRWNKSKKNIAVEDEAIKQEYQNLIQSFSGKSGPVKLPFQNKNYLPLPEEQISEVARQMRKRISDDTTYLHLQKTIAKAINNAGFFEPVLANRTQQSEYLVLIDEKQSNSQQVKLFDYLLELLNKQNVFIEKFYYRNAPALCYNAAQPDGISLEKLSEKYPTHILLLFGDAYQLIYQLYPVIDSSYVQIINRWQYKAVLTPVSFLDWGNKEKKVLADELPVFPVDIPGQIMLMQKLFGEEINILADLQQYNDHFYETAMVDFEDVDELYGYCQNATWANIDGGGKYSNILFQWIAALAVYPKIHWELTLAIGKAIMDKYGNGNDMNFTTLLRIARIKWMAEGQFPNYTRLNLLKKLTRENEIVARETILALLQEIPETDLTNDHFAFEEKETQRLFNEFNLYAYDPVKYASYKRSKDLMGQMWHNKQMTDAPAQTYIENKDLKWDTLINKPLQPGEQATGGKNISGNDYFGTAAESWLSKLYLLAVKILGTLFSLSLVGLVALAILNFSTNKNISPLTFKQRLNTTVKINYNDSTGTQKNSTIILRIDTANVNLTADKPATLSLPVDDSAKEISVQVDNNIVLDTTMTVAYDAYTVTMVKNAATDITTSPVTAVRLVLTNSCLTNLSNYKSIINKADSSYRISNDVITETNAGINNSCLSQLSYGKNVPLQKVNILVKAFSNSGIDLKINSQAGYTAGDNEIVIYNLNTTPPPRPDVYIQISDNSLIASANAFRNELAGKGFVVKPVSVQNYSYNSEISYYDASTAAVANSITKYYNKYYPQMKVKVQARLRKAPDAQQYKNIIAVWIRKLDVVPPPVTTSAQFAIRNANIPGQINNDQMMTVSFDIVNANNGKVTTTKVAGKICILSVPSCTDFNFNLLNNTSSINQQIDISKKPAGRHEMRVVIDELKIDTSLGYFTIKTATPSSCDTIHSYVGNGNGNIFFKGKTYVNILLQQKGFTLSLAQKDSGYAIFEITKDKCPLQKVTAYIDKAQSITFCDGSRMVLILHNWENKTGNVKNKEAIFEAIICRSLRINSPNQSAY